MLPTDDKARKALPLWDFMFGYFPDAWLEVVKVAVEGNNQHNPGEKLHWARGKSMDQLNTAFRHQFDYGRGVARDSDGCYHLAKAVWRLMAQLQLDVEADRANVERSGCAKCGGKHVVASFHAGTCSYDYGPCPACSATAASPPEP